MKLNQSNSDVSVLSEMIYNLYKTLRFDDKEYGVYNPVMNLKAIENHLLYLLNVGERLSQIDPNMVSSLLKKKQQIRFAENRATQTAEIERKNYERTMLAVQRSTGPTVKKVGKFF
jgi:hypothetical protein